MKILDTNFICSLLNQSDANHSKAKDIYFAIDDDEKIKIPFIVAAELSIHIHANKYFYAAKQITSKFIVNNEADLDFVLKISDKTRTKLKANDCLILALCKRLNADLLTFDKQLLKMKI
jgi:predicted nucleic acid-binding protein